MSFSTPKKSRRAISATEEEIIALLDRLDAQDSDADEPASESGDERFEYRIDSCEISLHHIGATGDVKFVVPTRNMSTKGMTFLHSGFAHTGSKCRVALVTNNGSSANIKAAVSGCRYVENWMHEIAVEFDAPVYAASFCPPSPEWSALVVVADDDEMRQVKHYLTVLRAKVKRASNCGEVITMVGKGQFDCVLAEVEPLGQGEIGAIKAVRANGYEGVILGVIDEDEPSKIEAAVKAGCTRCLPKPYGPEFMKAVYEAARGSAADG